MTNERLIVIVLDVGSAEGKGVGVGDHIVDAICVLPRVAPDTARADVVVRTLEELPDAAFDRLLVD